MNNPFCDLAALATSSSSALRELLETADWSAFLPSRDLPPLRARLERLQRDEGITPLHRLASERVLRGARLVLAPKHTAAITAFALSPCGHYLATGSDTPAHDYHAGGVLLLWEVASGRVIRAFDRIECGVGWTEHADCIQWSSSGRKLGVAFNTNVVGAFDPFEGEPFACEAGVTPGWDEPPAWCFSPDGERLFVATWGPDDAPGCVVPIVEGGSYGDRDDDLRWLGAGIEDIQPLKWVRWSSDGAFIYGHRHGDAHALDIATGALRYRTKLHPPIAWSADGARVAHNPAGLVFYDGATGKPTLDLPMIVGADEMVFSNDGARLAMVVRADNHFNADPGVHVFENGAVRFSLDASPAKHDWMLADTRAFAFSPDGARGACLTEAGTIEIWSLDSEAKHLTTLEGANGLLGLLWGAGDTLIGINRNEIAFWDAATFTLRARHPMLPPPGFAGPPTDLSPFHGTAKTLPIPTDRGWSWAVAADDGEMLCPPEARDAVAPHASFVVENRLAWPWAWAVGTPRAPLYDTPAALPANSPLRPRLRDTRPDPTAPAPFFTVEIGEPRPKGDDWAASVHQQRQHLLLEAQLLSFELNALPITHYRAAPVLSGASITRANLAPYVGQVVMYAEAWRPEHVTIGVLTALHADYFNFYYEKKNGHGSGGIGLAKLAWIGPAVPL